MAQLRIAIVGGRLQGIEAAYLCSKADFETVLIDDDPTPPAKGLTDEFHQINIVTRRKKAKGALRGCDAVLPANENHTTLLVLEKCCNELQIPFMQDNHAFWVTSDKTRSLKFFRKTGIPTPESWPDCGFPVIVKPSNKSGSESIYRADNKRQLQQNLNMVRELDDSPIVQEYVTGQALSLEVLSTKGTGQPLQITGLEFDETYGCKRVYAPVEIPSSVEERMKRIGNKVSSGLSLNGLTDLQALLKRSGPVVNEINARLPSQTPTVVYHSTKVNMAELLVRLFLEERQMPIRFDEPQQTVLYEHVKVFGKVLTVQGEHVMANATGLRIKKDFLGADETITNLELGAQATNRVATLIVKAQNLGSASKKMKGAIRNIMNEFHLNHYADPYPGRGRRS